MKIAKKVKVLFVFAVFLFFANDTQAQETKKFEKKFRFGIGLSGGIPIFSGNYNCSLGGDVRLQYDFSKKTSATLTTGFTNLFMDPNIKNLNFIPVTAGLKFFISEDKLYFFGEGGGGFTLTSNYEQTTYVLAFGTGYTNKNLDLSLRYEAYSDYETDQILLRIAYVFDL